MSDILAPKRDMQNRVCLIEQALDDALEAIQALASLTEKLSDRIRALESRGKY